MAQARFVELPPADERDESAPAGYRREPRQCFGCKRDFRVYVADEKGIGLMSGAVPCPYCGEEFEVAVSLDRELPVLVQKLGLNWLDW